MTTDQPVVLSDSDRNLEIASNVSRANKRVGIGMDCAVIPLSKHDLSLIQTVDFFYPLIDDPYIMGIKL